MSSKRNVQPEPGTECSTYEEAKERLLGIVDQLPEMSAIEVDRVVQLTDYILHIHAKTSAPPEKPKESKVVEPEIKVRELVLVEVEEKHLEVPYQSICLVAVKENRAGFWNGSPIRDQVVLLAIQRELRDKYPDLRLADL